MSKKELKVQDREVDKLFLDIKSILDNARSESYKAVNFQMVQAYWNIGKSIVETEQKGQSRAEYGKYLIKELSKKLKKELGKGFNISNLWYMRQFYLVFPILHSLRGELSWTHYRLLLKIEREDARQFYMEEAIAGRWSTRELDRQIGSLTFERVGLSKNKQKVKELSTKNPVIQVPSDIIKDPYVLEFLNLKDKNDYLESDLEDAIMNKLQEFLLELGKGFSFVGRQKRITIDGDHFFVDLVFYNYILKCFVLIDLKIGKLSHKDIGQMDFYVRYYEKEIKNDGDNPTIGLILCSDKNEAMVKYTLLDESNNLFASKYMEYFPTEEELKVEIDRELEQAEMELKLAKEDRQENFNSLVDKSRKLSKEVKLKKSDVKKSIKKSRK